MELRRVLGPALVAAATATLSACGGTKEGPNGKNFSGERKNVARVVDNLMSDSRSGNAKAICGDIFTPALAREIARRAHTTCEARVKQNLVSKQERITITQLTVRSPNATAQVQEQTGNVSRLTLTKQRGGWRISGIQ
jgi:hypothetical protein